MIAVFAFWAFILLVVIGIPVALTVRQARRIVEFRPSGDPVGELLYWHALWERDHPDLIVHASYAEYLPGARQLKDTTGRYLVEPTGLIRTYGGKRGGVDTSALIARFAEAQRKDAAVILPEGMTYERFSPGGYIPGPQPLTYERVMTHQEWRASRCPHGRYNLTQTVRDGEIVEFATACVYCGKRVR